MIVSTGPNFATPVLKEGQGAHIEKGEHARLSSYIGAIAVADLIKTTLGPKGMDKMLVSGSPDSYEGDVIITNDGATILKKIPVDNPAAKILVNISMTQDDEVGDGTTSVVVLAGELLREAEKLSTQKLHPQTIIRGWREALKISLKALEKACIDNRKDAHKFREDLINIAKTTLSSKIVTAELEFFSDLVVKAVLRLKGTVDLDMIQIVKKAGGSMRDSFLDDGFILDKKFGWTQPRTYERPRIMILNTGLDMDKIKIWGAKVKVHTIDEVAAIEVAEKQKMKMKVDKILKWKPNIIINRQLIYDYPEELFGDAGVGSIEHADFEGVERLARVFGAEIMSTFDNPPKEEDLEESKEEKTNSTNNANKQTDEDDMTWVVDKKFDEPADLRNKKTPLGRCERVEPIMIGEDTLIKFKGVPKGEACTIVLRGASQHLLDEMERSLHDAICVLINAVRESQIVYGGGAAEMLMAHHIEVQAREIAGKEQMAMFSFANALRSIPTILASNAGFDSASIVSELSALHAKGNFTMGVDMNNGTTGDMSALGVIETFKSKSQSLISAHEAAEMILRVDDIVKCVPRKREQPRY